MNISLTPEQSEYVRGSVHRDFGNASEFFRDLLRARMRREVEADLALLKGTSGGAAAGPSVDEVARVLAVQHAVRKELKRARGV